MREARNNGGAVEVACATQPQELTVRLLEDHRRDKLLSPPLNSPSTINGETRGLGLSTTSGCWDRILKLLIGCFLVPAGSRRYTLVLCA